MSRPVSSSRYSNRPDSPKKEDKEIDPKKFKRVLKIEKTDESEKKRARLPNLEEDEEEIRQEPTEPSTSFSDYMEEKERLGNVFDVKQTDPTFQSNQEQTAPDAKSPFFYEPVEETPPPPPPIIDTNADITIFEQSDYEPTAPQPDNAQPPPAPASRENPPSQKQSTPATDKSPQKTQAHKSKKKAPDKKKVEQKKKLDTPEKKSKAEFTKKPKTLSKTPAKESTKKKAPAPIDKKIAEPTTAQASTETKEPIAKQLIEGKESKAKITKTTKGDEKKKKGEKTSHAEESEQDVVQSTSIVTKPSSSAATNLRARPVASTTSPLANLRPDILDLLERVVGIITIQKLSGVMTTSVTIAKEGSVFNGSKLVFQQYDTARNSINVQLIGSAEANALFDANIGNLAAALQAAKLDIKVNLRPSSLKQEKEEMKKNKVRAKKEKQHS